MTGRKFLLSAALLFASPASGQEAPVATYREVMKAQYKARTPAPPVAATEAQRVYDAYLRTIGRSDRPQVPDKPNPGKLVPPPAGASGTN